MLHRPNIIGAVTLKKGIFSSHRFVFMKEQVWHEEKFYWNGMIYLGFGSVLLYEELIVTEGYFSEVTGFGPLSAGGGGQVLKFYLINLY